MHRHFHSCCPHTFSEGRFLPWTRGLFVHGRMHCHVCLCGHASLHQARCTLPAWRREQTGKELWSSKLQLGWLREQPHSAQPGAILGTRPAIGSHLSPTALWGSVPWLAAMRIPRLYSVTLGSALCLGSVQNVALPCKIATARHGVHLLYQKHKTAAVTTPCKAPRVTMVF